MILQPAIIWTAMSTSSHPGSILLLIQLTRSVYRRATEDGLGMKLKAYLTLTNLGDGAVSQQELCTSMHLDPNNCVLMLNDLEGSGYVERRRDPADRRRHIVAITDSGREALARADRAMESLEEEVLGALAPDERQALRALLARAIAGEPAAQAA
jgi:DNA-binding MarR family transcriptional regulator